MKATLHVPLNVEDTVNRVQKFFGDEGFIFSEEEATFDVRIRKGRVEKSKNWSRFWSRKSPLGEKYPPSYSIVVQGEIRTEEEGALIDVELTEYHASRPHSYGGAGSLVKYFEKICEIFKE